MNEVRLRGIGWGQGRREKSRIDSADLALQIPSVGTGNLVARELTAGKKEGAFAEGRVPSQDRRDRFAGERRING